MVTRIRKLLEQKQLTPTQFADLIGVGRPVMSHILSERNKPSLEVVQRIISAFPELSLPWLLSGVGEMLVEGASSAVTGSLDGPAAPENVPAPAAIPAAPLPTEPPVSVPAAAPPMEPAAFNEPTEAPAKLAAPEVAPQTLAGAAAPAPAVALPEMKPFRAARFVPPATVALPPPVAAPVTSPAVASPALPSLPTALPSLPTALPSRAAVPASPGPADAMLPFLAEPGKAIRRIVIFYRDGSFADYQPEQ